MLQTVDHDVSAVVVAYNRLRTAWRSRGEVDLAGRDDSLSRLRDLLVKNARAFAETLDADFKGRSPHESLLTEIALVIGAIDYTRPRLRRWTKARRLSLGWPHWTASAKLIKQGRGVAGIIGPSNYPLQLVLMPLISALAAGCRIVVKPSESAPLTAQLLCRLIAESLDPTIVSVVIGGPAVAAQLADLPLDVLLFSGSQRVGRRVALAGAAHLTPTILELGGKSAVIIDRDADLPRACNSIMWGKLVNAGQTCVAPDYVLVPSEMMDHIVEHMIRAARRLYPDPTSKDYTAIISDAEFVRLNRLEANQKAVSLFERALERPFYDPKLLLSPLLTSTVMQEEIFGPLLPLIPYDSLTDAMAVVNALPPALVLYWFGPADQRLQTVIEGTASAAVSVNETVIHAGVPELPLGGLGASGMGRYHGRAGFDAFTHERPIFQQSRFNVTDFMRPPFGSRADAILKRLLR